MSASCSSRLRRATLELRPGAGADPARAVANRHGRRVRSIPSGALLSGAAIPAALGAAQLAQDRARGRAAAIRTRVPSLGSGGGEDARRSRPGRGIWWCGRPHPLRRQDARERAHFPAAWACASTGSCLRTSPSRCPGHSSGGLDAGNVREAVSVTGAGLVDVSSGVESRARRQGCGPRSHAFLKAVAQC